MRRAIAISLSLLLGVLLAVSTFLLYSYHEEKLSYDDMAIRDFICDSSGKLSGKMICNLPEKSLTSFDYKLDGSILYITAYVNGGKREPIPLDEFGYADISFNAGVKLEKIIFKCGDEETELAFKTN